jgi:hypothetical protein
VSETKFSTRDRALTLRKFVEEPGGRRVGDRIAYLTRVELLEDHLAQQAVWVEERGFDEAAALREHPGLRSVFDLARRQGIAVCVKG